MFSKEDYWTRRKENKRGQGDNPKRPTAQTTDTNLAQTGIDNRGNVVVKNRAWRRRRVSLPGANLFTRVQLTKAKRKKIRKLGRK